MSQSLVHCQDGTTKVYLGDTLLGTLAAGLSPDEVSTQAIALWGPQPITRRLIPKSVVQERVNTIGKLGDAFAVLQANPIDFGRWFAPDWPNVYADDVGLLSVLTTIGCTDEQIAQITAE